MHPHVHRPVICEVCKAEMVEYAELKDWFWCHICGSRRRVITHTEKKNK
jgi:hypothetical protein